MLYYCLYSRIYTFYNVYIKWFHSQISFLYFVLWYSIDVVSTPFYQITRLLQAPWETEDDRIFRGLSCQLSHHIYRKDFIKSGFCNLAILSLVLEWDKFLSKSYFICGKWSAMMECLRKFKGLLDLLISHSNIYKLNMIEFCKIGDCHNDTISERLVVMSDTR